MERETAQEQVHIYYIEPFASHLDSRWNHSLVNFQEVRQRFREQYKHVAVFPCRLRILPDCIFSRRDPIVIGVRVEEGLVREGTPLCVPSKGMLCGGQEVALGA